MLIGELFRMWNKEKKGEIAYDRCGMNLLRKIIGEVKSEVEENHRQKQITIDDWIAMLQKGI